MSERRLIVVRKGHNCPMKGEEKGKRRKKENKKEGFLFCLVKATSGRWKGTGGGKKKKKKKKGILVFGLRGSFAGMLWIRMNGKGGGGGWKGGGKKRVEHGTPPTVDHCQGKTQKGRVWVWGAGGGGGNRGGTGEKKKKHEALTDHFPRKIAICSHSSRLLGGAKQKEKKRERREREKKKKRKKGLWLLLSGWYAQRAYSWHQKTVKGKGRKEGREKRKKTA